VFSLTLQALEPFSPTWAVLDCHGNSTWNKRVLKPIADNGSNMLGKVTWFEKLNFISLIGGYRCTGYDLADEMIDYITSAWTIIQTREPNDFCGYAGFFFNFPYDSVPRGLSWIKIATRCLPQIQITAMPQKDAPFVVKHACEYSGFGWHISLSIIPFTLSQQKTPHKDDVLSISTLVRERGVEPAVELGW
jgi:hypothetical protein